MRQGTLIQRHQGFTLIEVLIAIAVVGIMFASLASLQMSNIRVTTSSTRSTDLLEAAVDVFESVKVDVESDFAHYNDCAPSPCTSEREGASVSIDGAPTFGGSTPQVGLVEVTVSVSGSDGSTLVFRQIISCLEAAVTPTVSDPGECAE